MNAPNQKPIATHEAPEHPRAFTITALNRLSHGGITRCAPVPYLRMSGQWMAQHGFHIGAQVVVTIEDGRFVLTPASNATHEMVGNAAASHSSGRRSFSCGAPSHESDRAASESHLEDSSFRSPIVCIPRRVE